MLLKVLLDNSCSAKQFKITESLLKNEIRNRNGINPCSPILDARFSNFVFCYRLSCSLRLILAIVSSHYEAGVCSIPGVWHQYSSHFIIQEYDINIGVWHQYSSHFNISCVHKSFFFINFFSSFNLNLCNGNQRRVFSGNLPGMFIFEKNFRQN